MSLASNSYEVVIIGGGVSGTALLYALSKYTNVTNIALIEKRDEIAAVNSHRTSNSQTLHFGDIETNYSKQKAEKVNRAASLVKNYLLKYDCDRQIYSKYQKMVLAVGNQEVAQLQARYQEFLALFPDLKLIARDGIAAIEPKLVLRRDPDEAILALHTCEGYTIDFQKLAKSFLNRAKANNNTKINTMLGTKVTKIIPREGKYIITTDRGQTLEAKVVAVTAGAHSLLFAKSLGYGLKYALLCVAGSFYKAPQMLRGKVYTMQLQKLPFAAIHGDPEVDDPNITRFGPTAKVLPLLERHDYKTFSEYLKTAGLSFKAIASFWKILSDWVILKYIILNFIYDLPIIGKRLFIKKVRKIVPSIQLKDLQYAKRYGGIRPQIVNLEKQTLEMGEAKIIGDRIIFNITPSPGASTCLQNAEDDTVRLIEFLGQDYYFDRQKFKEDLETSPKNLSNYTKLGNRS